MQFAIIKPLKMPFDPITWATGYILTNAAKKGLEVTFSNSLRRKLENEIHIWAKEVSRSVYVVPEVMFAGIETKNENLVGRPHLRQLQRQFLDLKIPSQHEWFESLFEQWSIVRNNLQGSAQDFFKVDDVIAKLHLQNLALSLYHTCVQDSKTALPHIVNKLDQISVTLDELKYINNIRTTNSTFEIDLQTIKLIFSAIRKIAIKKGMPFAMELHYEKDEQVYFWHLFEDNKNSGVTGIVEIDENRIMSWAHLRDSILSYALEQALFNAPLFTDIDENWNSMVEFVARIAKFLYPNTVRGGWYGISANYDIKSIGVPVPIGTNIDIVSEEISVLSLGDVGKVPFLHFNESELQKLIGLGEVKTGGIVAKRLIAKWGPPTILSR